MGPFDALMDGFRGFSIVGAPGTNQAPLMYGRKLAAGSTNAIKTGTPIIASSAALDRATVVGTNEIQTLTFAGTVTNFTLAFTGRSAVTGASITATTPAIAYNADFTQLAQDVKNALMLLANIGDNVTVVRTSATVLTVTFVNLLGGRNVSALVSSPTGGGTVTVATGTAGVNGYVSSTTLLSFSGDYTLGPTTNLPRSFEQAPIDLENNAGTVYTKNIIYPPLSGRVFEANIEHDVIVDAATLVGTDVGIGWYPNLEQAFISTQVLTNAICTVVAVDEGEDGKVGGKVKFIVKAAAIAVN